MFIYNQLYKQAYGTSCNNALYTCLYTSSVSVYIPEINFITKMVLKKNPVHVNHIAETMDM
jgi:hypothetical protein